MQIRAAADSDLATLLALDAACFATPWSPLAWRDELASSDHANALMTVDTEVVAFACAPMLFERCELRRIGVHPTHRGHGLARDLLDHVMERAREFGCERIELEVAASNVAALALYRRAGFVEVGRRPNYYRSPPDDAVLLDRTLREKCR
ncbi:MAG: ribosomal protein S18-alanine N-acetyltransferase [Myxococcales bacterium]|nr:ribosomal protein S18-alanine N-acetyltransferase [Myxococcales bacterium]